MAKDFEPYPLLNGFQKAVALLCATRPAFWGRIGHSIDPRGFSLAPARLALEACKAIALNGHRGPSSELAVLQRIKGMVHEGKATREQMLEVAGMFEDASEAGLPSEDDVRGELAPVLRDRLQEDAARSALAFRVSKDLSLTRKLIDEAGKIGVADDNPTIELDDDVFAAIDADQDIPRLATGIMDLDDAIGGGTKQGEMVMWAGGTGDGKSMMMSHRCAQTVRDGFNALYATLEVTQLIVQCRLVANVTGFPLREVERNGSHRPAVQQALRSFNQGQPKVGRFAARYFTAEATTPGDIKAWVEEWEAKAGCIAHLVVIDMVDHLIPDGKGSKDARKYESAGLVCTALRDWNRARKGWLDTATHTTRKKDDKAKGTKTDTSNAADSMNKPRLTDVYIGLDVDDDRMLSTFVAKNRTGPSRIQNGPMATDWAHGRMVELSAATLGEYARRRQEREAQTAARLSEEQKDQAVETQLEREPGSDDGDGDPGEPSKYGAPF